MREKKANYRDREKWPESGGYSEPQPQYFPWFYEYRFLIIKFLLFKLLRCLRLKGLS